MVDSTGVIKVFLLDDHEIVRHGMVDLIDSTADMTVIGEAATVAQALDRIPACQPDVAILDARLPDGSGIDVCREIRSQLPQCHCLILTSYDDDDAVIAAVMAGAAGYLLKDVRAVAILDGIRQIAAGNSLLDPAVTGRVLARLRGGEAKSSRLDALSDRERAVLALIADGLTNREIGERLYLSEKTVKNYVSAVLSKLGMQRRTQAAVYATELASDHRHE